MKILVRVLAVSFVLLIVAAVLFPVFAKAKMGKRKRTPSPVEMAQRRLMESARKDVDEGRYEAATVKVKQYLAKQPADVTSHQLLAIAYTKLNKPELAIKEYQDLFGQGKSWDTTVQKNPVLWARYAALLRTAGKDSESRNAYRKSIDLYLATSRRHFITISSDRTSWGQIDSDLMLAEGLYYWETDTGTRHIEAALRLDPKSDSAHLALGMDFISKMKYAEAGKAIAKAKSLSSTIEQRRRCDEAMSWIDRHKQHSGMQIPPMPYVSVGTSSHSALSS